MSVYCRVSHSFYFTDLLKHGATSRYCDFNCWDLHYRIVICTWICSTTTYLYLVRIVLSHDTLLTFCVTLLTPSQVGNTSD